MAPWRCERHTVICWISGGYLLPVNSLHCDFSETGNKIPCWEVPQDAALLVQYHVATSTVGLQTGHNIAGMPYCIIWKHQPPTIGIVIEARSPIDTGDIHVACVFAPSEAGRVGCWAVPARGAGCGAVGGPQVASSRENGREMRRALQTAISSHVLAAAGPHADANRSIGRR